LSKLFASFGTSRNYKVWIFLLACKNY